MRMGSSGTIPSSMIEHTAQIRVRTNMLKVFGSPSRYIQGPQALDAMGPYLARLGGSAVLVADRAVLDLIAMRVQNVCAAAGVAVERLEFSGEIIPREVERLT